jgi:hypothetical protein
MDSRSAPAPYVRFYDIPSSTTRLWNGERISFQRDETSPSSPTEVPEPRSLSLLLLGLGSVALFARRRREPSTLIQVPE